jgi:hypothetical protein
MPTKRPTRTISARRAIAADLAVTLGAAWVAMLLTLHLAGLPLFLTAIPFGVGVGVGITRLRSIHEL